MNSTGNTLFNSESNYYNDNTLNRLNSGINNDKYNVEQVQLESDSNPFIIRNFNQGFNDFPSPDTFISSFNSQEERNYDTDYLSMMKFNANDEKENSIYTFNRIPEFTSNHTNYDIEMNGLSNNLFYNNKSNNIVNDQINYEGNMESNIEAKIENNSLNLKNIQLLSNETTTPMKEASVGDNEKSNNNNNTNNTNNTNSKDKTRKNKANSKAKKQISKKKIKSKANEIERTQTLQTLQSEASLSEINDHISNCDDDGDYNSIANSNFDVDKKRLIDEALSSDNLELSLKEINTCFANTAQNLLLMQKKLEKLQFLEKKRGKQVVKLEELSLTSLIKQTKEEIKMEKNRISAKRSRDKQKKKLEDLEMLTVKLKQENLRLYEKTEKQEKLMHQFNSLISKSFCKECLSKYDSANFSKYVKNIINKGAEYCSTDNNTNSNYSKENSCCHISDKESLNNVEDNTKNNESRSRSYSISMSNNNNSFSPIAKLSVFAGLLFIMCFVGISNIKMNGNNSNVIAINKDYVKGESLVNTKSNRISNSDNSAVKANKRMLLMNKDNDNYYSNYDFSDQIDLKNIDNIKAINNVLSRTGMEYIDKPKIIFETYKEIKRKNIANIDEKQYKEILK